MGHPHLYDRDIQRSFLDFVNNLITDRKRIVLSLKEAPISISDNSALKRKRDTLQSECEAVMELMRKMVQ